MSSSYSGNPANSDVDAVRSEIRDTNTSAWLLSDAEVAFYILDENAAAAGTPTTITGHSLYRPAARCCEVIARSFLAQADSQIGQLKVTSTKRAEQYDQMAKDFRQRAAGYNAPYSGGQSIREKESFETDADAVQPAFTRTEFSTPYTGAQDGLATEDFGPLVQ